MARIDWTMSSKMSAFFRLNTYYDHDTTTLLPAFPDTPAPSLWAHPWGVLASHNWAIGRNWVNSFRYGLRSEEHTSELQSQSNLVCRLLLEKKKKHINRRSLQCKWSTSAHTARMTGTRE